MKNNNGFLKIIFLYFYMYFIGPLIWGGWMVFRLKIISLQECIHCIFSPVAIMIFFSYFFFNLIYMKRLLNKAPGLLKAKKTGTRIKNYTALLKVHCLSIISFGTIGTFVCLSMLSTNNVSFFKITLGDWLLKVVIGALSGTSLVFLFYIMFSTIIITTAIDIIEVTQSSMKKKTLINLKLFNLIMYLIGLVLFVGTAVTSLIYRINSFIFNRDTTIFFVTLIFPIVISGLLYYKSNNKIDSHINIDLNSNTRVIFNTKSAVQMFSLVLFCLLLFAEKIQLWLVLLIAGFCASLIFGRVYCGWICPVNTVNGLLKILYNRLNIKKRPAPQFLQHSLSRTISLLVFLFFFTFSLILGKRLQLFLIFTCLGIFISSIFVSSFWCNYLCPWGTIFKTTSKFSASKRMINEDKCTKCLQNCIQSSLIRKTES